MRRWSPKELCVDFIFQCIVGGEHRLHSFFCWKTISHSDGYNSVVSISESVCFLVAPLLLKSGATYLLSMASVCLSVCMFVCMYVCMYVDSCNLISIFNNRCFRRI